MADTSSTVLVDTPSELQKHYDMVLACIRERISFLENPEAPIGEPLDHITDADLAPLVRVIQSRISFGASLSEAAMLFLYREVDSFLAEYNDMRLMTRADYYEDAIAGGKVTEVKLDHDLTRLSNVVAGKDLAQR